MERNEVPSQRQFKRLLKSYAGALRQDPGNLVLRLKLAFVLRELGRKDEAVDMYRNVALAYAQEGRLVQAMAVCKGILEIDPQHSDTQALLAELAQAQGERLHTGTIRIQDLQGHWLAVPMRAANPDVVDDSLAVDAFSIDTWSEATPEVAAFAADMAPSPVTPASKPGEPEALPPLPGVPDGLVPPFDLPHAPRDVFDPDRTAAPTAIDESRWVDLGLAPMHDDSLPSAAIRSQVVSEAETMCARPAGAIQIDETDLMDVTDASATEEDLDPFDRDERQVLEALATPMPSRSSAEVPPVPLLSALPRDAFVELIHAAPLRREPAGRMILREGDPGDAFYIIVGGHVRVLKNQPAGSPIEVARLGPGAFFGEFAVLSDRVRHASVEAIDEVELFEISRTLLDQLTVRYPEVSRTLRRFYRERLLETLIATAPFFAPLAAPERVHVAGNLKSRRFPQDHDIVVEGGRRGGLYLILLGQVKVTRRRADGTVVPVAHLGEGSYFGEMSLLRGGAPPNATVTTLCDCEIVELPAQSFYEFVSRHPELWHELKHEAERREQAAAELLSGDVRHSRPEIYLV